MKRTMTALMLISAMVATTTVQAKTIAELQREGQARKTAARDAGRGTEKSPDVVTPDGEPVTPVILVPSQGSLKNFPTGTEQIEGESSAEFKKRNAANAVTILNDMTKKLEAAKSVTQVIESMKNVKEQGLDKRNASGFYKGNKRTGMRYGYAATFANDQMDVADALYNYLKKANEVGLAFYGGNKTDGANSKELLAAGKALFSDAVAHDRLWYTYYVTSNYDKSAKTAELETWKEEWK